MAAAAALPHSRVTGLPRRSSQPACLSQHPTRSRGGRQTCALGGDNDAMAKVQRVLGQAMQQDRKTRFGPPPPADREAGSGFVNLVGMEDLLAGEREFNVRRRNVEASAEKGGGRPSTADTDSDLSGDGRSPEMNGAAVKAVESGTQLQGLQIIDVSPQERIVATGLAGLTLLAFAKGSADLLSENVLQFLQGWMFFAWSFHFLLACAGAWLAQKQGRPPLGWFAKILLCGAIAFEEDLWKPALESVMALEPKKPE